ncbi:uncharacterized protein LOC143214828 [Lasioglossum baleicum]|uniref:uncharacterized protein LOC143214828 n=1 Tax=Lasioglossum baleicum TaxID=434251 RepID=UPI003FCDFE93
MFKKTKVKSATRISQDPQGTPGNNLRESPSFGRKNKIAARKQKSQFSKTSVNTEDNAAKTGSKDARLTSNLPKDAAVHFGNFYGLHESTNKPRPGKIQGSSPHGSEPTRTTPRLEFTRQMVHKLERTAGTEEYARQVSALLEETVEPAHFRLHSLPTENSIPDGGRQNPSGYPLWYKEPYKTPLAQADICKLLKSEQASGNSKDIFDEDLSEKGSPMYLTDEEDILNDPGTEEKIKAPESVANLLSSVSSSATEAKDTDYTSSDSR